MLDCLNNSSGYKLLNPGVFTLFDQFLQGSNTEEKIHKWKMSRRKIKKTGEKQYDKLQWLTIICLLIPTGVFPGLGLFVSDFFSALITRDASKEIDCSKVAGHGAPISSQRTESWSCGLPLKSKPSNRCNSVSWPIKGVNLVKTPNTNLSLSTLLLSWI